MDSDNMVTNETYADEELKNAFLNGWYRLKMPKKLKSNIGFQIIAMVNVDNGSELCSQFNSLMKEIENNANNCGVGSCTNIVDASPTHRCTGLFGTFTINVFYAGTNSTLLIQFLKFYEDVHDRLEKIGCNVSPLMYREV